MTMNKGLDEGAVIFCRTHVLVVNKLVLVENISGEKFTLKIDGIRGNLQQIDREADSR